MGELTREDLLREEALVRAREVCCTGQNHEPITADLVVQYAEKFFAFLNPPTSP